MPEDRFPNPKPELTLQAYLLGEVGFDALLALQRRLVYEVAGERDHGCLILCEHPPLITIGREGSRLHVGIDSTELAARGWPVRWVNRGGGCLLHLPGQVAAYAIVALDRLGLDPSDYVARLGRVVVDAAAAFGVTAELKPGRAGVWAGGRLLAHVGVAVRDWVAYYGFQLNVHPNLAAFRPVRCGGPDEPPMTSLERQRHAPQRMAGVRLQLVESFAERFGFAHTALFHSHPALPGKVPTDAVATGSR